MKKLLGLISTAFAFMAIAMTASAQGVFDVKDTDQSKKIFLDTLFGPLVGGSDTNGFGEIIGIFNGAMLILGGVLVAYTLIAGTMSTAHDGEMLGKRWSSLWIPIRTSVGAALLFPINGTYCAVQYVVMWIALQGIGFANKIVDAFIDRQFSNDTFVPPSNYGARREMLEKWLIASTCQKSTSIFKQAAQGTSAAIFNPIQSHSQANDAISAGLTGRTYMYGPVGACGIVYMSKGTPSDMISMSDENFMTFNGDQFKEALYEANIAQMPGAKSKIDALAEKIASGSDTNEDLRAEVAGTLDGIAQDWDNTVKKTAVDQLKASTNSLFVKDVKEDGWLLLGGWYMEIARKQDFISKAMSNTPITTSNAYERVIEQEKDGGGGLSWKSLFPIGFALDQMSRFDEHSANSIKRAKAFSSYTYNNMGSNALNDATNTSSAGSYLVKWFITPDYKSMFDSNADYTQNPVIMAQNLGRNMVGWGTAGYVAGISVILFLDREVLGNSTAKLSAMSPMLTAISGTIIVTGAFLSVYPPMLPYVLWIGAILGWVIFLVESIIAAPLWVVAQIAPDGDGVVGKGGQGYMLVLSLFMRPALMVLGFISAVIVMKPMGYLINSTFLGAFMNGASPSWYGIVTSIMGCILYATLMVSVISKVFALIHVIPDKILRWMGGGGDSDLGSAAQGVEGNTLSKTMAGAHVASTIGQSGVGAAQNAKSIGENAKQHDRNRRQNEYQGFQQSASGYKQGVDSSIEQGNDGLRDMSNNHDFSKAGDDKFDLDQRKVQEASDKLNTSSLKSAMASANAAIANVAAKGREARQEDKDAAREAQSFLNDVSASNVNPNDPKSAGDFMAAQVSRGTYRGTSWGDSMQQAVSENNRANASLTSLAAIRAERKNNAQNDKPDNQVDRNLNPHQDKDPNQGSFDFPDPNKPNNDLED